MPKPTARFKALEELTGSRPIVAVDLGYSSKQRSCGVARSKTSPAACFTFGGAIAEVARLCIEKPNTVLVLEAVLSTSHCEKGNPRDRGEFEKGRSWYYGPGAVTFVAATRFLTELDRLLPRAQVVDLAEAFLSNKEGPTGHHTDADLIARTFWKQKPEPLHAGLQPILPLIHGIPPVRSFAYAR